jgi:ABC-type Na+ efflux pump permease subunit
MGTPEPDPVRARRALMDRLARSAKRLGYALLGVALAVFVVGAATSFTPVVVGVVVGSLAVGSVFLLPAIVVGYGVRAAEREDRDGGAGRVR